MSAASAIEAAVAQLQARGATPHEVEHARGLLAWLAEHNRTAARVELAPGVVAQLPGNPAGRGCHQQQR